MTRRSVSLVNWLIPIFFNLMNSVKKTLAPSYLKTDERTSYWKNIKS